MNTVPAAAAAVLVAGDLGLRDALAGHLVLVGVRPEVDLDSLACDAPVLSDSLKSWWAATQDMWSLATEGEVAPGAGWVQTQRVLVSDRQSTAKGNKRDLVEAQAAIRDTVACPLLDAATEAEPDVATCKAMAAGLGGSFDMDEAAGTALLRFRLLDAVSYPDALGGPVWATELSREVTVTLNYAAWRTRRLRRIVNVEVTVDELWAQPHLASA